MFGPDPTQPVQINDDNNNIIGFTHVMGDLGNNNWSGFHAEPVWDSPNNYIFPVSFNDGGILDFYYENNEDTDMAIWFKFERYNYDAFGNGVDDTNPSFFTEEALLQANTADFVTLYIGSHGEDEFNNILLYLKNKGSIAITNITLNYFISHNF